MSYNNAINILILFVIIVVVIGIIVLGLPLFYSLLQGV